MKIFLLSVLLLLVSGASAQNAPLPSRTPVDDQAVVRISTNLIQVDVTVTDTKGKPVPDLRPDEIEIYENGVKQKITGISYISGTRPVIERQRPADPTAPPVPSVALRPEQIRRTIALVVDDLSLSFESAYHTRRALKKFVDEQMQPGDLVAIVRTGAGIGALQQFTADKRMLYAAIEKVKWNPLGSGGISAFAPIRPGEDILAESSEGDGDPDVMLSGPQSLEEFRSTSFVTGTLGALRYIVTGMSELPGRKSVILFSDGMALFERSTGYLESGRAMDFMSQLIDAANRSSVVFYTVDARGLVYTGYTAADQIKDPSPQALSSLLSARRDILLDTQEGLGYLARQTGGLALQNNNDLSSGVRRALEDQSYYLIAYEPDAETFDPAKRRFNKLDVKVLRSGTSVRHRSGFINVADRPRTASPSHATVSPLAALENALVSPFAVNGIDLSLNTLFASDSVSGSYVRSLLHVNARDLSWTEEKDGTRTAVFDVLAMSFGDNGQPVGRVWKSYTLNWRASYHEKLMSDGFVYHFQFPVKKPGAYQYRVAIRDTKGGTIGSASQFIEVPDLKKKRLTASSIVLQAFTTEQWKKALSEQMKADPMSDTALRRIKTGSVLQYGYEIYNARLDPAKQPRVQARIRVFRDGQIVLDGQPAPVDLAGQNDLMRLKASGAISIGSLMVPGDYLLQVIATDPLAKGKQQIAAQFIQFEVVP